MLGRPGYIFVPAGKKGWLIFDHELRRLGAVPIQPGESPGGIVLSPSQTAVALIATRSDGYSKPWRYQMLAGQPLQQRGELTTADPFPGVTDSGSVESTIAGAKNASFYRIASGDQWFFDDLNRSYLTRRSTNVNDTVLADAAWLAP